MIRTPFSLTAMALGLMSAATIAHAQSKPPASTDPWQAQYQAELAQCESLTTPDAVANCRREAGAAYETARKGELTDSSSTQYQQNAVQRCQSLPIAQRDECLRTMQQGSDTQVYGSVSGGGILRRTEITTQGAPIVQEVPSDPVIIIPKTADPALETLPRAGDLKR